MEGCFGHVQILARGMVLSNTLPPAEDDRETLSAAVAHRQSVNGLNPMDIRRNYATNLKFATHRP
jgi:hypothetical protein